jgi:hypothetical protein
MKLPSGPGVSAPDAADVLARATDACRRISTISAEVAVTGTVGDAVLEAVTGVPLRPSELRTVLTGCADGSAFTEARQIGDGWLVIRGAEELYLRRARPTDPWRLVAVIHRGTSGPEWRAEYSDFLNNLPRTIRLRSVDPRRFDLRLALTQVETNVPLEPDAFKVKVPPGTPPIALDELREAGPLAGAASRSNGR